MLTEFRTTSMVFCLLSLAACDGRGRTGGPPPTVGDASTDAPAAAHDGGMSDPEPRVDGGMRLDASLPEGGSPGGCTHEGFPWAFARVRADGEILQYSAIDNLAGDPTDLLQLQRFYSFGATRSDEPQFVTLREESYADCSTCVVIFEGCTLGATVYDAESCDKTYLGRSGSVELTIEGGPGESILAFFHDVELAEVVIDPETLESTVVPGGETWCLPSFTIDHEVIDAWE